MVLIAYLIFVTVTFPVLFTRDRFIGLFYAMLFVYSFFALFGYLYLPGYSETLNAYFGDHVGHLGLNFVFGSMALIFAFNMVLYRRGVVLSNNPVRGVPVIVGGNRYGILAFYGLLAVFGVSTALNFSKLDWYIAELDSLPLQLSLYLALFKLSAGIIILAYAIIRLKLMPQYRSLILPTVLYALIFLAASVKLGNRTDPAALIAGGIYFESARSTLKIRTLVTVFLVIAFAATLLTLVEATRYSNYYVQIPLTERIVKNDYFAPAHVMLGAIAYDYVDPGEVLRSNFSNALVMMRYPFLQKPVMDLFAPGVATRSASYAFYLFTEGYMVMGFAGILYNAGIVTLLVKFWNSLGCTSDSRVNLVMRSVLATMIINLVRGQSSYFFKYLYMFFIPVMLLAIVMLGLRLASRMQEDGREARV